MATNNTINNYSQNLTVSNGGQVRTLTTAADAAYLSAYDTGGASYTNFVTLTAGNPPTCNLATGVTIGSAYIYRAGGTDVPVADGGTGASTLTDHGVLVGSGTSPIDALAVGTTGQLLVGSSGADPAFAASATGDFTFTSATAAQDRTLAVTNTDATAANYSAAHLHLQTNSATTGDPYVRFDVSGGQDYSMGVDNSDSDALKITDDTNPSTGNVVWKMTSAGERTMSLQPAFLAGNSSTDNNQTGAGTYVTCEFDSEVYDQNGDYNTATDTFTAPVTGRYLLCFCARADAVTAAMTYGHAILVTSNRSYYVHYLSPAACRTSDSICSFSGTAIADMDSGDTSTVQVYITNGAGNTAGLAGNAVTATPQYFCGCLLC